MRHLYRRNFDGKVIEALVADDYKLGAEEARAGATLGPVIEGTFPDFPQNLTLRATPATSQGPLTGVEAEPEAVHPKPPAPADALVQRLRDWGSDDLQGEACAQAADRIERETARADRAEERARGLEALRPVWAMGHTSDSVAAQVNGVALADIWAALGVSNQSAAIDALRALKADNARLRDAIRAVETSWDSGYDAHQTGLRIKQAAALTSGGDRA